MSSVALTGIAPTVTQGSPPPPNPFNVVLVVSDDQGYDSPDYAMSNLKAHITNGDAGWWRCTQAVSLGAQCNEGRGVIITGKTITHNGMPGDSAAAFDSVDDYLPARMSNAGYITGGFGKWLNAYPGAVGTSATSVVCRAPNIPPHWNTWWADYTGEPSYYNFVTTIPASGQITVTTIPKTDDTSYSPYYYKDKLVDWITSASEPWFAYYCPKTPHSPYGTPVSGITTAEYDDPPDLPNWYEGCTAIGGTGSISDKPNYVQSQACPTSSGAAAHRKQGMRPVVALDRAVYDTTATVRGAEYSIWKTLVDLAADDHTIIIFTTDNGNSLGSHRFNGKELPYEEVIKTPFFVYVPGTTGGTIDELVTAADVAVTIVDYAGGDTTGMDGRSLKDWFDGLTPSWRTDTWCHHGTGSLTDEREFDVLRQCTVANATAYKLVRYNNPTVSGVQTHTDGYGYELYDLTSDPYEQTNLLPNSVTGYAGQAGWSYANATFLTLKARLEALIAAGSAG